MKHIAQAAEVLKNAYAPYSRFQVGAVVVAGSGKTYSGCNVENASFSATICAERVAIGQAIASGEKSITHVYLITSSERICYPCGVCLQVISEFGKDVEVVSATADQKTVKKFKLTELLPYAYDRSFLK